MVSEAAEIEYDSVHLAYPRSEFLLEMSLRIARGEIVGILGRSGSGKSTAIKVAAGLIRNRESQKRLFRLSSSDIFHTGRFLINGVDCGGAEPGQRHGFLISQNANLYPHLTISDNLLLIDKGALRGNGAALLKELNVLHTLDRFPSQISGGEAQRVSLVKAMIAKSSFLMFDEPVSALDQDLRIELLHVIRAFHERHPRTYIFVSHDQDILMLLAHRIAVLDNGRIIQTGTADTLLSAPEHSVVAETIDPFFRVPLRGLANVVDGFTSGSLSFRGNPLPQTAHSAVINTRALGVRDRGNGESWFVKVDNVRRTFIGGQAVLQFLPQGSNRAWTIPAQNGNEPIQNDVLRIPRDAVYLFNEKSTRIRF